MQQLKSLNVLMCGVIIPHVTCLKHATAQHEQTTPSVQ